MHVRMEKVPGFTAIGIKYRGKNEQNEVPQLWETFVPRMGEIGGRVDMEVTYGVMDNFDRESGAFDYIACVEVEPEVDPPEGMVRHIVPDQTYAVFQCTLPNIHDAYRHAYREWLPTSDYERSIGPEFELYGPEFHVDQTLYLYIPVKSE